MTHSSKNLISMAVKHATVTYIDSTGRKRLRRGYPAIAHACGVSPQAVMGWERRERMPRTEMTGETNYASVIEKITKGRVVAVDLLAWSRKQWSKSA
jgi:DNA-binding transcriptional regulator YiaG